MYGLRCLATVGAGFALVFGLDAILLRPNFSVSTQLEAVYQQRLTDAQSHLRQQEYDAALALTVGLPKNSTQWSLAQQLRQDIAQQLLELASRQYRSGDLDKALAHLNQIPADTPVAARSLELRSLWQVQLNLLNDARQALLCQRQSEALQKLQALDPVLYRTSTVQSLLDQISDARVVLDDRGSAEVLSRTLPAVQLPQTAPLEQVRVPVPSDTFASSIDESLRLAPAPLP